MITPEENKAPQIKKEASNKSKSFFWEFPWDWKKASKAQLEKEWHHTKKVPSHIPFTLIFFIVVIVAIAYFPTAHYSNKEIAIVTDNYQRTNSVLTGQLLTTSNLLEKVNKDLDKKTTDYATTIANLNSDHNEELRKKDVEITKVSSERDNALSRLSISEAMPNGLLNIYSNLTVNTPTNLNQFGSILMNITNVMSQNSVSPDVKLIINESTMTNGAVIAMGDGTLKIQLINYSGFNAEDMRFTLNCPSAIDPTNVVADGWQLKNFNTIKIDGILVGGGNNWECPLLPSNLPGRESRILPWIKISTNSIYPVVAVTFRLTMSHIKFADYQINLLFPNAK